LRDNLYIHDLFPYVHQLINWIADDGEDIYNTKLPLYIKNQLDAVDDVRGPQIQFQKIAKYFSQELTYVGSVHNFASLWTPKELERAIKSHGNLLPFSLPREKKVCSETKTNTTTTR